MSIEDEIELKDLLMQTLQENGCLAKIKAQLRASVFLALEENADNQKKPLLNGKVKSCLDSSEGQLMFCIVKEFLEYFNLQSTMAVFDAESYLGVCYQYNGRNKISEELGLAEQNQMVPLLKHIVQLAQQKPKLQVNLNITEDKFENVDQNISNSEISLKTESILNGELSDTSSSSSSNVKDFGVINVNNEILNTEDINNAFENGHEDFDNLDKTYITESHTIPGNVEDSLSIKKNLYDIQLSMEGIPINSRQDNTLPVPVLEKIENVKAPVLKDLKLSPERVKSPPKTEKFKSKNSLNSLSDLPPLNMNKSRSGKILPTLYTKEFIEKSNS